MSHSFHTVVQPVALVADVSPSMGDAVPGCHPAIHDLNDALGPFYRDLREVQHCDIEVCHISFADQAKLEQDFESVNSSQPVTYTTRGTCTDISAGVHLALQQLHERREALRMQGLEVKKGWVILLSDGMPNRCNHPQAQQELIQLASQRKLWLLPVAVGGHLSYPALEALSPSQAPVVVHTGNAGDLSFVELFRFLSDSISAGQVSEELQGGSGSVAG